MDTGHRSEVINGKFYVNIYICEVPDFPLAVMVRILRHLQYAVKYFNSECLGPKNQALNYPIFFNVTSSTELLKLCWKL